MACRLDAIGIVVAHMGDALDFYRRLGLFFPEGSETEPHAEASGPGGIRIMLDTEESVKSFSDWRAPSGSHRVALAFLCDQPSEVDERFMELTASGVGTHLAPFDAPWGQRYATVLDPSGNPIDLFAWMK
ncbi:MAG TPA: VOC family protein [Acidimicrobiia bacterium]|nr:VOC family protein [Acidimicrobiia bacterium]